MRYFQLRHFLFADYKTLLILNILKNLIHTSIKIIDSKNKAEKERQLALFLTKAFDTANLEIHRSSLAS